jgi:hypothetical protein
MIYTYQMMAREVQQLAEESTHIAIDRERTRALARAIGSELEEYTPVQTDPALYPDVSLPDNDSDTLQFYLLSTSQHFCIWRRTEAGNVQAWDIVIDGKLHVGARGINAAHIRALRRGQNLLDPTYLASMTMADVLALYRDERDGKTSLQMLPQRLAKLNEIGNVLERRFGGQAANLLAEADGYLFRDDGQGLVQLLLLHFPTAYFDWPFNKLAILLGKLLLLRNAPAIPTTAQFRELTTFRDPQHFAIAADYYIPLFFIRTGVFRISDTLARRLRTRQLIERNSRMEWDYRASTIVAGQILAAEAGLSVPALDEALWQSGFMRCRLCRVGISDEELPCPYRNLSVAYQSEHELMELAWPLVLTPCY